MKPTYTTIPATIARLQTMADGALRVVVDAQEVADEVEASLLASRRLPGHFIWIPQGDPVDQVVDPPPQEKFPKGQSPSQRLRKAMFDYWEGADLRCIFNTFYQKEIEALITYYKEKE